MKINSSEQLNKTSGNESPFMAVDAGDTTVRIVGDIHAVKEHNITINGKPRFIACPTEQARMEIAAGVRQDQDVPPCPLCELGYPVKTTYLAMAVEREREEYNKKGQLIKLGGDAKILKKGQSVFGPIQALIDDANWGPGGDYDVKITATGEGLERRYSLIGVPANKSLPLTANELRSLEDLKEKVSLEKMTTPLEYAKISEEIGDFPVYVPKQK